jgi:ELP3 family radical SAM enzyme/protein acetyltransferase
VLPTILPKVFHSNMLSADACAGAGAARISDIEDYARSLPSRHTWRDLDVRAEDVPVISAMLRDLKIVLETQDASKQPAAIRELKRRYKRIIKPSHFTAVYLAEREAGLMERSLALENHLITARARGVSGVTVVTVFLSPYPNGQQFTCKWDCSYCPNEPGQPRSYLFGEPGVLRANQNGFDCAEQMWSRIRTYKVNGHPTDKFEVLILGGTIHSYPKDYLETFMRDIYYAANVCEVSPSARRPRDSLAGEKAANAAGSHRVIGVTVETRPDCINAAELRDFRRWGVTRVQLGVQHTDDAVLRAVNRGAYHRHTLRAMRLLRDSCFKVDIHLMPNLPTATPDGDRAMFDVVLRDLHPDQVKIYPCETTPFTKILDDYKAGTYTPYSNEELTEVVLYWKTRVHPWIRNNRIVRDIPDGYVVAGVKTSSQRCEFQAILKARGGTCACMRCREAGRHPDADPRDGELVVRTYEAQEGTEYFISHESRDRSVLFGFCRLRLPRDASPVFAELAHTALVRELHVYGRTFAVGTSATTAAVGDSGAAQHLGIGRSLLAAAERIAVDGGYHRIAVISGVGVRNYYARSGYALLPGDGEFMGKTLAPAVLAAPASTTARSPASTPITPITWFIALLIVMLCIILQFNMMQSKNV